MPKLTAVDLFAGAGGASEGLKRAGFSVEAANELNAQAIATYSENHPDSLVIAKDVRKLSALEILKTTGRKPDLLFAGMPCQGFSTAGRRSVDDPRNFLFKEVLRLARELSPSLVLIENVIGLLTLQNGSFAESIRHGLRNAGYSVSERVFDASDYGVPQKRKRLFILGSRMNGVSISKLGIPEKEKVTVGSAIGDLAFLPSGSSTNEYQRRPATAYQRTMRGKQKVLLNHQTSLHSQLITRRFSRLAEGGTLRRGSKESETRKLYALRLDRSKPAPTMTTLPDDFIHYAQPRILSVREMARLQSFPDSYSFLGPRTTGGRFRTSSCCQYTQVGNAVPPLLMENVATGLAEALQ